MMKRVLIIGAMTLLSFAAHAEVAMNCSWNPDNIQPAGTDFSKPLLGSDDATKGCRNRVMVKLPSGAYSVYNLSSIGTRGCAYGVFEQISCDNN